MTSKLHWTLGVHHDGSALYISNPLPAINETVTIHLRVPLDAPISAVFLRTAPDGENHYEKMIETERNDLYALWSCKMPARMPHNPYRFKILSDEGAYYVTALGTSRFDSPDFYDFKLLADYTAPNWVSNTVFYQIFPDRFHNGDPENDVTAGAWALDGVGTQHREWGAPLLPWKEARNLDFYGGDLPGITQKVDYLRDLGVNGVYMTPIFKAQTNHRYDILDFHAVDPYLGGDEALAEMRRAFDAYDMRIMLDVTLNHSGNRHPWFVEAQKDPNAPTTEFFTFHEHPHNYESWLGVSSLVKFNYRSEKLRDLLYRSIDSVLRHWLQEPYRIDGWRLDVANMQARQGEIQLGNKIGRQLRRAVKGDNPQAYILGEHFYDASPHLQGNELDATMNYQGFTIPTWRWLARKDQGAMLDERMRATADYTLYPSDAYAEQLARYRASVPWVIARHQFNLLGSHDTARILSICDGDKALAKLGVVLLMTYPGLPCVYYGDEIGMEGAHDPYNRATMIWDESQWDHDMRAHYQQLIALHKTAPALNNGGYQQLYALDGLFVFQRQSAEQRLIVIAHRGPENLTDITIPVVHAAIKEGAQLVDLLSGSTYTVKDQALHVASLARASALVLEEKK